MNKRRRRVSCWIVVVTQQEAVAFPPEIYLSETRADLEAGRWAGCLALAMPTPGASPIQPLAGTWLASTFQIRKKPTQIDLMRGSNDVWVGFSWDEQGYLEVDGEVLYGRGAAHIWVSKHSEAPSPIEPAAIAFVQGVSTSRGARTNAAHLAKLVSW